MFQYSGNEVAQQNVFLTLALCVFYYSQFSLLKSSSRHTDFILRIVALLVGSYCVQF